MPPIRHTIIFCETILTLPNGGLICHDHLGEKFYSRTTMYEHWGVSRKVYEYRISHGWTQEEALTKPV